MVIHLFIIKLGNNYTKKNRNFKVRKFAEFKKKTINFKVMKTIRNELKYPIGLYYQCFYIKELRTLGIHFFMQLQKEQQTDNKQKINENLQ